MLLVVDTNILVNAIKSPGIKNTDGSIIPSKSQRLFIDILDGKHKLCVSSDIMAEYEDVLNRPQLNLSPVLVAKFLSIIRLKALWIEPLPTNAEEVEMGDEDDRVFFDVARCLNVKLVTRNLSHYPVHELRTSIDELY